MTIEILGLDVAKSCGIAWVKPSLAPEKWRALALEADGDDVWGKVDDFDFDFRVLLHEHAEGKNDGKLPDFAVIERPLDVIIDHKAKRRADDPTSFQLRGRSKPSKGAFGDSMINATTTLTLAGMAGNTIGILNGLGIPYGFVRIQSWRTAYYGEGVKPDGEWRFEGEKPAKWSENWKDLAIRHAKLQGVDLPSQKKAAGDAAEAVGIAVSWKSPKLIIPKRHQHAWMQLRMGQVR